MGAAVAACALAAVAALWAAAAVGEVAGGVAGSGIEQGTGAITTRSDVEMAVESLKGTSRARLGAVGKAVGGQLTARRGPQLCD